MSLVFEINNQQSTAVNVNMNLVRLSVFCFSFFYKLTKDFILIGSLMTIDKMYKLLFDYQIFDADTALSFRSGSGIGSSVNCDDTHARPHFKLVNKNFNAFVHCSSELN